jgi:hypothetical protein
MSAQTADSRAIRRQTKQFIKAATAQLTGRARGPDHDPEGKRRVPRRESYDVEDDRAKPWKRLGDGSVAQGLAYRDALLQAAKELYHQLWKELPLREVRAARDAHTALQAELDRYTAGEQAAVGRPAAIRRELEQLKPTIEGARHRLQRTDLGVLEALVKYVDFATGRLFPSIDAIAHRAGCHRNSVIGALKRLRHHGLIAWVRRSVRTANEGEFAPQREQTSNAYYFDHRRHMQPRVWQRYWQLLLAKLRRFGSPRPPGDTANPAIPVDPELRATLERVGAMLAHAST